VQGSAPVPTIREKSLEIRLDLLKRFVATICVLAWPEAVLVAEVHDDLREVTLKVPLIKPKVSWVYNFKASLWVLQDLVDTCLKILVEIALGKGFGQAPDSCEEFERHGHRLSR